MANGADEEAVAIDQLRQFAAYKQLIGDFDIARAKTTDGLVEGLVLILPGSARAGEIVIARRWEA